MLAGNRYLTRCHSSLLARAQLRSTATYLSQTSTRELVFPVPIETCVLVPRSKQSRKRKCVINLYDSVNATRVAPFSTTSQLSARPRIGDPKYLKPRGKPKFRVRTKNEHNEFLRALQEAQDQYDIQLKQGRDREQAHGDTQHSYNTTIHKTDPLKSPYFAVPDLHSSEARNYHRVQLSTKGSSGPPGGFPKLSQVSRKQVSTGDLEQELYYLSHNDPNPTAIRNILKILITDRKSTPTPQHYEALILANTWPEFGSVGNIEQILSEIETEGIEIGANIIAAVLKALAIHPSPGLSHRMLAMVERRWIQLSSQTHHHLILGMIRTGQTELAASMLEMLRQSNKPTRSWNREVIPDYLVVLLITELVKIDDWEGILRHMYRLRTRRAADREIPVVFWGWLLERASIAAREVSEAGLLNPEALYNNSEATPPTTPSNQETTGNKSPASNTKIPPEIQTQLDLSNPPSYLTQYLWTLYVTPMSLRPTMSTCLNVLHTASNTGTPWLAESAVVVMTYMDGVDENFKPKVEVGDEIKALVEAAKRRSMENEVETAKREGRDLQKEKEQTEEEQRERKRKLDEIEEWWTELFSRYDNNEKDGTVVGKGRSPLDAKPSAAESDGESDSAARQGPDGEQDEAKRAHQSSPTAQPSQDRPAFPFDPNAVPPGNLWPFFPSIDGIGSAHVDPWDALGPRSSARRKWTEAQQHFKRIEKASRKKH